MEMNEKNVFFMTKGRCGRSLDRKIIYLLKPTFLSEKWVVVRICDCIETKERNRIQNIPYFRVPLNLS